VFSAFNTIKLALLTNNKLTLLTHSPAHCGHSLLCCSGQSGASAADEDMSTVLGPGQVGPKLDDNSLQLMSTAALKTAGE